MSMQEMMYLIMVLLCTLVALVFWFGMEYLSKRSVPVRRYKQRRYR